jgi:hypothetical protein
MRRRLAHLLGFHTAACRGRTECSLAAQTSPYRELDGDAIVRAIKDRQRRLGLRGPLD